MMHDTERHRGGKGELISKLKNIMGKLSNGINYRETHNGYYIQHLKREIYIIAKSVNAGEQARKIIAGMVDSSNSFDKVFKTGKKINALGNNVTNIIL